MKVAVHGHGSTRADVRTDTDIVEVENRSELGGEFRLVADAHGIAMTTDGMAAVYTWDELWRLLVQGKQTVKT